MTLPTGRFFGSNPSAAASISVDVIASVVVVVRAAHQVRLFRFLGGAPTHRVAHCIMVSSDLFPL